MKTIAQQLNVKEFPFEIKDKNNNEIYYEGSRGFWNKSEHDENNNILYYEDSDAYWAKWEYDENNNQVYFESSNAFWEKREYNENNNEVYFENSYGTIIDNRPKKFTDKVVTIDGVDYELKEIKR